jgi:hypothetical protein
MNKNNIPLIDNQEYSTGIIDLDGKKMFQSCFLISSVNDIPDGCFFTDKNNNLKGISFKHNNFKEKMSE